MGTNFLLCISLIAMVCSTHAVWVNQKVVRNVDLKTHIVKITSTVTMRNDGPAGANNFEIQIEADYIEHLAFMDVNMAEHEADDPPLKYNHQGKGVYRVNLQEDIPASETVDVIIEQYFTRSMKPYPVEITQSQKQLVTYSGNHLFYSPYLTESQTTNVELFSSLIENYSKFGKTEVQESSIKYGGSAEYENVKPLSKEPMSLHFENNSPFLVVTKMTRVIEISHWGNIAVEETLDMFHTGAKFKGSFSRYDYQRIQNSGVAAMKSFKTILPASSMDVYYRDEIGNISTSNLISHDDSVEVEIRPRFPLFGGWKTHYYLGYNLPSYTYLYKTGDLLALRMRFVDHVYDEMVIDDLTVKVILPESCKHISVSLPYEADRLEDTLHYTYLDTVGRPVITFKKKNVVEQHIKDFTLSYNFNRMMLLQEPLLVFGSFFLLFFTVIIIVRLDFSITHDKLSEARMKVQGVIDKIQAEQEKRHKIYSFYEKAISDFKENKDTTGFANSRKSIDKKHKDTVAVINSLLPKLREDGAEVPEKVQGKAIVLKKRGRNRKVQRVEQNCITYSRGDIISFEVIKLIQKDATIMEKYSQSAQLAEKLVQKRITKDQYLAQNPKLQHTIDEEKEAVFQICDNL